MQTKGSSDFDSWSVTGASSRVNMERWVGRVALVTGASVGIGAAICRKLAQLGLIVVGCARNVDQIKKVKKIA